MPSHLSHYVALNARMKVLNGLRVGSGAETMEIGALDNPIIRHPFSRQPYIPGSSLKGKLRSLLEIKGITTTNHPAKPQRRQGPCGCGKCVVCWLFGSGDVRNTAEPTRLIFRDAFLTAQHRDKLSSLLEQGVLYSETKSEVVMDRVTGKVASVGPRTMDRIMAGTELDLCISIRVFEGDDVEEIKEVLIAALKMLHRDTLGGSGTRGYGWVGFPKVVFGSEDITSEIHTPEELERMSQISLDK
ncbi:MAG: CRISPR type III-associated RAMP protein Csm3 [Fimbriimonadales bacterium]